MCGPTLVVHVGRSKPVRNEVLHEKLLVYKGTKGQVFPQRFAS